MAIDYSLFSDETSTALPYKDGTQPLEGGFYVNQPAPLDSRQVVRLLSDLHLIAFKYEGMIVYVQKNDDGSPLQRHYFLNLDVNDADYNYGIAYRTVGDDWTPIGGSSSLTGKYLGTYVPGNYWTNTTTPKPLNNTFRPDLSGGVQTGVDLLNGDYMIVGDLSGNAVYNKVPYYDPFGDLFYLPTAASVSSPGTLKKGDQIIWYEGPTGGWTRIPYTGPDLTGGLQTTDQIFLTAVSNIIRNNAIQEYNAGGFLNPSGLSPTRRAYLVGDVVWRTTGSLRELYQLASTPYSAPVPDGSTGWRLLASNDYNRLVNALAIDNAAAPKTEKETDYPSGDGLLLDASEIMRRIDDAILDAKTAPPAYNIDGGNASTRYAPDGELPVGNQYPPLN